MAKKTILLDKKIAYYLLSEDPWPKIWLLTFWKMDEKWLPKDYCTMLFLEKSAEKSRTFLTKIVVSLDIAV